MKTTEYEVRILEINHQEMVKKLKSLGAKLQFDSLQERMVYDLKPKQENKWIRLRTNGKKTTLTIKDLESKTIDGTKELEIEVNDFEKTNEILNQLGYMPKGYQETKRTEYVLDDVIFDIDRWPLIPEFMEIEWKNKEDVFKIIEKLDIPKEKVITSGAYEHYGIDSSELENLNFDMEKKQ